MITTSITPADIQTEIRRLASESPDHVYDSGVEDTDVYGDVTMKCLYTKATADGRVGSCIIGKALINLGIDPEWLAGQEGATAFNVLTGGLGLLSLDRTIAWINSVQGSQDNREPWGDAVAQADELFPGQRP